MRWSLVGGLAVASSLALGSPSPGHACLHVVEFTKDDAVAEVARADRMVSQGRPLVAYRAARRARRQLERDLRENERDRATLALIERARTITALAVVRLDGWTPASRRSARRYNVQGRAERSLTWALGELRTRAAADPANLRARAQLAEALARLEPHHDEARAILADLAARDLMPEAHGYATLSRLLPPMTEAWHDALNRCRQMAADAAPRICLDGSAA